VEKRLPLWRTCGISVFRRIQGSYSYTDVENFCSTWNIERGLTPICTDGTDLKTKSDHGLTRIGTDKNRAI